MYQIHNVGINLKIDTTFNTGSPPSLSISEFPGEKWLVRWVSDLWLVRKERNKNSQSVGRLRPPDHLTKTGENFHRQIQQNVMSTCTHTDICRSIRIGFTISWLATFHRAWLSRCFLAIVSGDEGIGSEWTKESRWPALLPSEADRAEHRHYPMNAKTPIKPRSRTPTLSYHCLQTSTITWLWLMSMTS